METHILHQMKDSKSDTLSSHTHTGFVQTIQHVQLFQCLCTKVIDGLTVIVHLQAAREFVILLHGRDLNTCQESL